jgi:GMP synthase-like glutamine amidotransferase
MKILLVNNHTVHLDEVKNALAGHEIEVVEYRPGVNFNDQNKDLVILSGGGGEGLEISDKVTPHKLWYQDEMEFVLNTSTPVLGICMGFEVIVQAHKGKVHYRPELTYGFKVSHVTRQGQSLIDESAIKQVEAHYWYVPEAPQEFDVLARSESGIEVIRHKQKKLLGTQFHPEVKGGTLSLASIASQFVAS